MQKLSLKAIDIAKTKNKIYFAWSPTWISQNAQ